MNEEDLKQIRTVVRAELQPLHTAVQDLRSARKAYDFASLLRGASKSATVWINAVIFALPDLLPLISPELNVLRDPAVDWTIKAASVANILTRLRTRESLAEKGSQVRKG